MRERRDWAAAHQKGKPSVNLEHLGRWARPSTRRHSRHVLRPRKKSERNFRRREPAAPNLNNTLLCLVSLREKHWRCRVSFGRAQQFTVAQNRPIFFLSFPLGENYKQTSGPSVLTARARRLVFHTRGLNYITKYFFFKRSEPIKMAGDRTGLDSRDEDARCPVEGPLGLLWSCWSND